MPWEIGHRLNRDGTSQHQRIPAGLLPEEVPIDARKPEELLMFLYQVAEQFLFYNEQNVAEGTWQDFFEELKGGAESVSLDSIRRYLDLATHRKDNSIFLSLIHAFLHLYTFLQDDINQLSKKHLDYYYEQILGFYRNPPKPDEVYVLFELAKQAEQQRLPAGTALKAGKDVDGKPLTYVTNREIVVNQARLASIKTTLVEKTVSVEPGDPPEIKHETIFYAEAANSANGKGNPIKQQPPLWPLFGDPAFQQAGDHKVGFAIASPLLFLKEGDRFIRLQVELGNELRNGNQEAYFRSFDFYASGEQSWIKLELWRSGEDIVDGGNMLTFRLNLPSSSPSIVGYNPTRLDGGFDTQLPVLKMVFNSTIDEDQIYEYLQLKELTIQRMNLQVSAGINLHEEQDLDDELQGVQKLVLLNDQGFLNNKGGFLPFGTQPARKSRLYIGSEEVFTKPLETLTISFDWEGIPLDEHGNLVNFNNYYGNPAGTTYPYPERYQNNANYAVNIAGFTEGRQMIHSDADRPLFANDAGNRLVETNRIELGISERSNAPLPVNLYEFDDGDYESSMGFLRLSLTQDFGHYVYPHLLAEVTADPSKTSVPNPPYTPKLRSLSLGYTASQSTNDDEVGLQFFHLEPFGSQAINFTSGMKWLPQLPTASFYLGISKLTPPQNVHFLFQLDGSSAIPLTEAVKWEYLTPGGWEVLKKESIFLDTTQRFQQTGIIGLSVPEEATKDGSLMPKGLHWLRASIPMYEEGLFRCLAIHTQAVKAVFQDQRNAQDHLETPLPSGSITSLGERLGSIKKVAQPYPSVNGAAQEKDAPFYRRISERLRHRNRAITIWDLERLVLEAFPEVYKVKAVPHTGYFEEGELRIYSEFQPGQLLLAVIPNAFHLQTADALRPQPSTVLLENIRNYLLPFITYFVGNRFDRFHVVAPKYEPLRLEFRVGFRAGFDPGYYSAILQEAIRTYLSPWAYTAGEDISFGGKVYASQLLTFIERQAYVDHITEFKVWQTEISKGVSVGVFDGPNYEDDEKEITDGIIEAVTAISVLASAQEHVIMML